jgi:hypothetical protein
MILMMIKTMIIPQIISRNTDTPTHENTSLQPLNTSKLHRERERKERGNSSDYLSGTVHTNYESTVRCFAPRSIISL